MKRIGLGVLVLIALVLVVALCFDAGDDDEIGIENHPAPVGEMLAAAR